MSEIYPLFVRNNWRASLVPAAAVIPAPIVYIKVVAVKKLVVGFWDLVVFSFFLLLSPFFLFSFSPLKKGGKGGRKGGEEGEKKGKEREKKSGKKKTDFICFFFLFTFFFPLSFLRLWPLIGFLTSAIRSPFHKNSFLPLYPLSIKIIIIIIIK